MGAFTPLDTREVKRGDYQLLSDFRYLDSEHGEVRAHGGFFTNYASLKSLHNVFLFVIFALIATYGDKSATIHDYLYSGYPTVNGVYLTRAQIDKLFYRALRAEGIARWRAALFYAGVRVGGKSAFYTEQLPLPDASIGFITV